MFKCNWPDLRLCAASAGARPRRERGLSGSAAAWARELPRDYEGARAACGTSPRHTMGPRDRAEA